jgi:hypothetical protein
MVLHGVLMFSDFVFGFAYDMRQKTDIVHYGSKQVPRICMKIATFS